jgi:hypothetical protein
VGGSAGAPTVDASVPEETLDAGDTLDAAVAP